ncbi:MAG: gephyrin-like molybdotransferase Glp [Verrucomicrobiota bacterium]
MLELEEARRRIFKAVQSLPGESVLLSDADGRVLEEKIISPINLPGFDNSAVDGYAVQSKDLISANRATPISLRLIGKIPAGKSFSGKIELGNCVRIFTGSPLPSGADAVAMQEETQVDLKNADTVLFFGPAKPWENIRFRGEDIKAGATLAEAGTRLGVGHLSLLGAVGVESVRVARQPIVGLLATGSELREAGQPIGPSEIFESNRIGLAALARRIGAVPRIFPLISDTLAATKAALEKAFAECDAVVTTGGVSVGELDFVKAAFENLGGKLHFWKISIKPGKPFVFGQLGAKPLFGLPGNPVSALVTFILLAAPALARMQGIKNFSWPSRPATLGETLENRGNRRHFVRVFADENGRVHSAGTQASHILSSFAKANGLLEISPETILAAGTAVSILRLD